MKSDRTKLREMAIAHNGLGMLLTLELLDELERAEAKLAKCKNWMGFIMESECKEHGSFCMHPSERFIAAARACLAELECDEKKEGR